MSRPSRITNPGAVPLYRLGTPVDGGAGSAPPVSCCDVDADNIPNRALERTPFSLREPEEVDLVQSVTVQASIASVTFAELTGVVAGRMLVAVSVERSGGTLATPTGWTRVGEVAKTGFGNSITTVWTRVAVADTESITVTKTSGSTFMSVILSEFSGAGSLTDFATTPTTGDSGSVDVGPVDVAEDGSLAVLIGTQIGVPVVHTATGYTLIDTGESGTDPTWSVFWGTVDTPDETATITSDYSGGAWSAFILTFEPNTTESTWSVLNPRVTDGDDATYNDVDATAGEHLRFDLGAEYRIVRTRIRLGTTTSGAKTLTLYGANLPDFSDVVEITDIDFTATGSLTAQDVTDTFAENTTAYRYYQFDGPSEVVRWFTVEFYEPTLSQSHQHDTIDPDAVMNAGRWELAVVPGSPPDSLYADGDWLYIWVPGA